MLFMPCSERKGSAYYEFQYCRKAGLLKRLLPEKFWDADSLIVYFEDEDLLFRDYGDILSSPHSPDGSNTLCMYGVNYYDVGQTSAIIDKIRSAKPWDSETIIPWLERAVYEFNGFYLLGI